MAIAKTLIFRCPILGAFVFTEHGKGKRRGLEKSPRMKSNFQGSISERNPSEFLWDEKSTRRVRSSKLVFKRIKPALFHPGSFFCLNGIQNSATRGATAG
ncbi:hypothetical protein CH375_12860 [Leptospira ellisii]|nr:hypothetical protein CH375_12860 [Leptospira ellisii]